LKLVDGSLFLRIWSAVLVQINGWVRSCFGWGPRSGVKVA
jgi:hypothetical protein